MNHYEFIKGLVLDPKQKITVVYRDIGGNVRMLQRYFISLSEHSVGGVLLELKPKRRGYANNRIPINPMQEVLLYDGWVDIDLDDILYTKEVKRSQTVRVLKYENYQSASFKEIASRYPEFLYGFTGSFI